MKKAFGGKVVGDKKFFLKKVLRGKSSWCKSFFWLTKENNEGKSFLVTTVAIVTTVITVTTVTTIA